MRMEFNPKGRAICFHILGESRNKPTASVYSQSASDNCTDTGQPTHCGIAEHTIPAKREISTLCIFRQFAHRGRCAPSTSASPGAPAGIFTWTSYSSLLGWLPTLHSCIWRERKGREKPGDLYAFVLPHHVKAGWSQGKISILLAKCFLSITLWSKAVGIEIKSKPSPLPLAAHVKEA